MPFTIIFIVLIFYTIGETIYILIRPDRQFLPLTIYYYIIGSYLFVLGILLIVQMRLTVEQMEILKSEQRKIGFMLLLIVLAYFILGSVNLFSYLTDKNGSFLCNRNTLHIFVIFLIHLIANGLPLMFLLNNHHKSYRKNQASEPSGVDVTFYDDLNSESDDDRR